MNHIVTHGTDQELLPSCMIYWWRMLPGKCFSWCACLNFTKVGIY
jgi:hypothetical protein